MRSSCSCLVRSTRINPTPSTSAKSHNHLFAATPYHPWIPTPTKRPALSKLRAPNQNITMFLWGGNVEKRPSTLLWPWNKYILCGTSWKPYWRQEKRASHGAVRGHLVVGGGGKECPAGGCYHSGNAGWGCQSGPPEERQRKGAEGVRLRRSTPPAKGHNHLFAAVPYLARIPMPTKPPSLLKSAGIKAKDVTDQTQECGKTTRHFVDCQILHAPLTMIWITGTIRIPAPRPTPADTNDFKS